MVSDTYRMKCCLHVGMLLTVSNRIGELAGRKGGREGEGPVLQQLVARRPGDIALLQPVPQKHIQFHSISHLQVFLTA